MTKFKFLHAADLHIDSPLRGLGAYEDAPREELQGASRRALQRTVELARSQAVDFVVLAGDLFDGDWKDYSTGIFLNRELARLECPVYCISGNHDAESVLTRTLQWPENVHRFDVYAPETRLLEHLGVALHGQGFADRREDRNLAAAYPDAVPGYFNLGLLHTSADGREGHETYAPCTVAQLQAKGYDYWALGHVHQHEVLCRDPYIVFPGCLQGRHVRETGPKGCYVVSVEDGRVADLEFHKLDVVRWDHLEIDLGNAADGPAALAIVAAALRERVQLSPSNLLAVRLTLCGASPAHDKIAASPDRFREEIRNLAAQQQRVWLEKVLLSTRPYREREDVLQANPALHDLVFALRNLQHEALDLETLLEPVKVLREKLPVSLRERFLTREMVGEAVTEVEHLIWANLESR